MELFSTYSFYYNLYFNFLGDVLLLLQIFVQKWVITMNVLRMKCFWPKSLILEFRFLFLGNVDRFWCSTDYSPLIFEKNLVYLLMIILKVLNISLCGLLSKCMERNQWNKGELIWKRSNVLLKTVESSSGTTETNANFFSVKHRECLWQPLKIPLSHPVWTI